MMQRWSNCCGRLTIISLKRVWTPGTSRFYLECMVAEKNSVTITIRGKKYPLRTEADSLRVQQVVEFVNRRLDELDQQGGLKPRAGVSDIRLVMLALLNIADECLEHQQKLCEIKERSEDLAERDLIH